MAFQKKTIDVDTRNAAQDNSALDRVISLSTEMNQFFSTIDGHRRRVIIQGNSRLKVLTRKLREIKELLDGIDPR